MKRFLLEAVVYERYLWELMSYLEKNKIAESCRARPLISNGADVPEKKTERLGGPGKLPKGSGLRGEIRAAMVAIIGRGETFSIGKLRQQFKDPSTATYQAAHALLKDGVIKRVAPGEYAAGRKTAIEKAVAAAMEANKVGE